MCGTKIDLSVERRAMKNVFIGSVIATFIITLALVWSPLNAAIAHNSGTLQQDANNQAVQVAPGFSMLDGSASAKAITNLALTSNVVTITAVGHGYIVGQQVVIAMLTGPTLFADCNGTFVIASVPGVDSFTYAFTHANISTGAATGTATAYFVSPMPAATGEIALVAPAKAIHLVVVPTSANMTWRKTSGGATNGTFTLYSATTNHINAVEGDTIYLQRGSSTAFEFVFDCAR